MTNIQLYNQIAVLPESLKKKVADFVAGLKAEKDIEKKAPHIKERQFGYAKGFFRMSADFDEPLDDFNDYM